MNAKERKLKLVSTETDRRSTIDEEGTVSNESCCCLGFWGGRPEKAGKDGGGRKLSVREKGV